MPLRRELLKVAILAATLLALLPGSALAAQWLDAEPLDPGFISAPAPDVTTDAGGNSAAVWIGSTGEVNAAVRPRGGPWGAPQNLEPRGLVHTGDAPLVIAEPDGEFVAVWVGDYSGTIGNYIRWARKPPGQDWSAPDNIVQATAGNADLNALEVGAAGDVTVMWTQGSEGTTVNTNTKPAGSESWGIADFVTSGDGADFALATAPDGSAAIAFPGQCETTNCVQAEYRPKGGDWSADPEDARLATGTVTGVALVARPDSSYTVAWGEDTQPQGTARSQNPPGAVRSADRAPGSSPSWSQRNVTVLPDDAAGCRSSTLGCIDLASRGDQLAVVWQQNGAEGAEIEASQRTADGAWGARERVGDVGNAVADAFPQAALTADGTAVAAWGDGTGGSVVARASYRAADGTWTQRAIGTAAEGSAVLQDVVADDLGDAVTAWRDPSGVQAAGFDGAGPRFTPGSAPGSFSVPATGTAGQPLTFSASVEDNWSGVADISWLFGDGGSADGGTVTHTYGSAGVFTATATATDSSGNTSQQSGATTVAAAATPAPGPTPDPCGTTDRDKDGINDACDTNDGSAPPVAFKTVNATVVSGEVFIKLPAGTASAAATKPPKGFVRLLGANTIPVGSTLDTAKGRVKLRSASDTRKHVQTGQFFRGRFVIRQVRTPRGKAKRRSTKLITVLTLTGSSFSKTCKAKKASISRTKRSKKRVRRLFGDGKGRFRTSGRNAAATVKGTRWSVQDRCDGTLVTVQRGRVSVRDLVRHRTVLVKTGHTYLARRR